MMTREYFRNHVMIDIEVWLSNGGKTLDRMTLAKARKYCDDVVLRGNTVNGISYSIIQPDNWVRKVLNTAHYNWNKNKEWVNKTGIKTFGKLIEWIIENKKV